MLGRFELMKKLRRFLAFVLCAALCFLLLTGCGSRDTIRFKMIAELNQEEFCVAFRKGDPLCNIFTAALKELSADGQISRAERAVSRHGLYLHGGAARRAAASGNAAGAGT